MTGTESNAADLKPRTKPSPQSYYLWIVLLITTVTYLGTLKFDFVSDDYRQIVSNPFMTAWRYFPRYFSGVLWGQLFPPMPGGTYRPIQLLWTRLIYAMFTDHAIAWHGIAVALHVVATCLVFVLVQKMTGRFTLAWLTALLFGVHPVHHEVVAWVWGSSESFFAILFLVAFLAYLQSLEKSKSAWMSVSCFFYALGLLSNGSMIVLPLLVLAHGWITSETAQDSGRAMSGMRLRRALQSAAIYTPVAAVYLFIRYKIIAGQPQPAAIAPFSRWMLTLPSVLCFYAKNWFFPNRLSGFYDLYYQSQLDARHVLLPALLVLSLGGAIWISRKWLGSREVSFAAIWILVPLLPALAFMLFPPDELVHDRYFYVPSIGASMLIALVLERALRSPRQEFGQSLRVVAGALVLALGLAMCSVWASRFWKTDEALFTRAHEIAPANSAAASGLSEQYIDAKQLDQAEALLQSAGENGVGDSRFLLNLGRTQYLKKQYSSAEENIRRSIAVGPHAGEPYVYLGMIQLKQDHPHDALANLQRAVEISPEEAHFHTSYGIVLEVNGDCTAAMSQFAAALALSPGDGLTQREMFRCREKSVKPDSVAAPAKP